MRFKKFIEEAVINIDMTVINKKIKQIKTLELGPTPADGLDKLNQIFKEFSIEFGLRQGKSKNGISGGVTYNNGDIKVYLAMDYLNWISSDFPSFAMTLSSVLEHELIHREQDRRVSSDNLEKVLDKHYNKHIVPRDLKKYYASDVEIMAHANSIVRALQNDGYTNEEILDLVQHVYEYPQSDLPPYFADYIKLFRNEPKVLKRLFKAIYQYVKSGEQKHV